MTVTTETFIVRYMDGDAEAGIYINGDNDPSTVGLNAQVIYFYQGMINAKDANLKVGTYWQTNETDGVGSANLVLDNSTLDVSVNEHNVKATGNSTVTLKNSSAITAAGGFTFGEDAKLNIDDTSSIAKTGKEQCVAIVNGACYESIQSALDAAKGGASLTILEDVNTPLTFSGTNVKTVRFLGEVNIAPSAVATVADGDDAQNGAAISVTEGVVTLQFDADATLVGAANCAGIYVAPEASVIIKGAGTVTAIGNGGSEPEFTGKTQPGAAGIGGQGSKGDCGDITIDGATVIAQGFGGHGAGIGSGSYGVSKNITIKNGANVTAKGGYYVEGGPITSSWAKKEVEGGAGIGGGSGKHDSIIGDITIDGSTVAAYGGHKAAGIGAGFHSGCGNIIIKNGSVVTAEGGSSSAAIGTSRTHRADSTNAHAKAGTANISIDASTVNALGGNGAAAIGTGFASNKPQKDITTISITNGSKINAIGGVGGAAIGGGGGNNTVSVDIKSSTIDAQAGKTMNSANGFSWYFQVDTASSPAAIGSGADEDKPQYTGSSVTIDAASNITVAPAYGKAPIDAAKTDGTANTIDATIVIDPVNVANAQAKIGDVYYASLEDAIAKAIDGDTITLLADAQIDKPVAFTEAVTIDLNDNTLDMTAETTEWKNNGYSTAYYVGAPLNFKNGNMNVSSTDANYMTHGVFYVNDIAGAALTFEDVNLVSNGYSAFSFIHSYGKVNLIDSVVNVTGTAKSERFAYSEDYDQFIMNNSVVTATGLTWHGSEFVEFIVEENSKLTLDGAKSDIYLGNDKQAKLPKVDSTSVLNAEVYIAPAADGSNFAETVKLSYEPTDKQNVYNIYVEAAEAGKTINRLSAIQLKFKLESDTNMSYTLAPVKGVSLTNGVDEAGVDTSVEDVYVFNFTGENNVADKTGAKIQIGTVTFGGYGTFNFKVVESDGNYIAKAKTATATDNIVDGYVPAAFAGADQGIFDLDASALTGAKVEEVKREVKVVIAFNNNLDTEINSAAYNDMTVTLTGSNGKTYSAMVGDKIAGSDAVNYNAEKAELVFNVEAGYRYTVTVSGAGYRTVRYTTLVDEENVELNFWNNALENADRTERTEEIEAGVARSAKAVTFLAGDISPDNLIDKYDLAAVVSYFGYDNLKSDAKYYGYAKYDLNRDGQIDADDIATVLISWGK